MAQVPGILEVIDDDMHFDLLSCTALAFGSDSVCTWDWIQHGIPLMTR
jgi:hypothetical protein